MKNLILIRHGKSSWEIPYQDKDRLLVQRGIDDARLVSIDCLKYLPSTFVIFSSSAMRTRETAMIFSKTFLYPIDNIYFSDDLYTFDEKKVEKVIKSINNEFENVILFGHNVGITNFVNKFGDIFIDNIPTSGLVWLQFETDFWKKINKGKTIKTIFPRNLK